MQKTSLLCLSAALVVFFFGAVSAQTTAFTYQGNLRDGTGPANGNYDFEFALFDTLSGGNQVGSTIALNNIAVANGIFSVKLDFSNQFVTGASRFLEVRVRLAGQPGITTLGPRQPVDSAPYSVKSIYSSTSDNALDAAKLGGIAATQYVLTGDPRMSDARAPTAGSANYIQNQNAAPQTSSNFNISGNGTAGGTLTGNIIRAATQFNIGNSRVLAADFSSVSAGLGAGPLGNNNSFFGANVGNHNTSGFQNSFFGLSAGEANTSGQQNAFFGALAGNSNTTASGNAFFGDSAGAYNTTGSYNSFFGESAGLMNTVGTQNVFMGLGAGQNNTSGSFNVAIGMVAGQSLTTEGDNTFIGYSANGAAGIFNSTAIGANASVTQNNSLVLGSINGVNGAGTSTNVGIGITAPTRRLHVVGDSLFNGVVTVGANIAGPRLDVATGVDGQSGPVDAIRIIGPNSPADSNSAQDLRWSFLSAGSAAIRSFRGQIWDTYMQFITSPINSNTPTVRMHISENGNVGIGTTSPGAKLHVNGDLVTNILRINDLSQVGQVQDNLCAAGTPGQPPYVVRFCGTSSIRYKTNITDYRPTLGLVNQLRPVTFDWKSDGKRDFGLIAEEVEDLFPEIVIHNKDGQVEGVKYDRIGVVLINAVKEQQEQIEALKTQVDLLTGLVCKSDPTSDVCKKKE